MFCLPKTAWPPTSGRAGCGECGSSQFHRKLEASVSGCVPDLASGNRRTTGKHGASSVLERAAGDDPREAYPYGEFEVLTSRSNFAGPSRWSDVTIGALPIETLPGASSYLWGGMCKGGCERRGREHRWNTGFLANRRHVIRSEGVSLK